jgi:hypothetical protein
MPKPPKVFMAVEPQVPMDKVKAMLWLPEALQQLTAFSEF